MYYCGKELGLQNSTTFGISIGLRDFRVGVLLQAFAQMWLDGSRSRVLHIEGGYNVLMRK